MEYRQQQQKLPIQPSVCHRIAFIAFLFIFFLFRCFVSRARSFRWQPIKSIIYVVDSLITYLDIESIWRQKTTRRDNYQLIQTTKKKWKAKLIVFTAREKPFTLVQMCWQFYNSAVAEFSGKQLNYVKTPPLDQQHTCTLIWLNRNAYFSFTHSLSECFFYNPNTNKNGTRYYCCLYELWMKPKYYELWFNSGIMSKMRKMCFLIDWSNHKYLFWVKRTRTKTSIKN